MKESLSILTAVSALSIMLSPCAKAQFQACVFDNANGSNAQTVFVAKAASATFPLSVSQSTLNIYFGNNASSSASGMNEFEAGGIDVTNNTGGDLSETLVAVTGLGFWTQNIANTEFQYFTWDAPTQSWTGVLGDGSIATMKLLGGSVDGVNIPAGSIQVMPATSGSTGYNFAEIPNAFSTSFIDQGLPGGPTVHSASGAIAMPNSLIYLRLGTLPAGATLNNVRIKIGLSLGAGSDAWVNFASDSAPTGDYDYYVQAETVLLGTTYDYGDAPASYGTARHAPGLCTGALYIGPRRQDYESSAGSSPTADFDDDNTVGYNDETSNIPDYFINSDYNVTVPYVNNVGSSSMLSAWIDWNNNGVFEPGERAWASVPTGTGSLTLTWVRTGAVSGQGSIPTGLTTGNRLVRFRIGSQAAEVLQPFGTASDGEIEDLTVMVEPSFPVKLVTFNASIEAGGVTLVWQTTQEKYADYFAIESSTDARKWRQVGQIKAAGESDSLLSYTFRDTSSVSGIIYYRLKMVDVDETFSFSRIRMVNARLENSIRVYPNPASRQIFLEGPAMQQLSRIEVISGDGSVRISTRNLKMPLDVGNLAAGTYILKLIGKNNLLYTRRLTVIK